MVRQNNVGWILYAAVQSLTRHGLSSALPYGFPTLLLVCFVLINGGVALGDKTHHPVTVHLMQLEYLAVAIAVLLLPLLVGRANQYNWRRILLGTLVAWPLHYLIVRYSCVHHPYLLADDCHLTGIVWRFFYSSTHPHLRLHPALHSLLYSLLWALIVGSLGHLPFRQTAHWIGASALVTVPSPLLEPRYFVCPVLFFLRLQRHPEHSRRQMLVYFVAINCCLWAVLLLARCQKPLIPTSRYYML